MHGMLEWTDTPLIQRIWTRDRRRRLKRPRRLILVSWLIILIPFLNYISLSRTLGIHYSLPIYILEHIPPTGRIFLLLPIFFGAGLLMVQRWAWWSLLLYTGGLTLYNIFTLIKNPVVYNISALVATAIFLGAAIFFLRRDISAPYFKLYPRGWRLQKRQPIQIAVLIGDREYTTSDVSESGFYITGFDGTQMDLGTEFEVTLSDAKEKKRAALVRSDSAGAGFAFRGD